MKKFVVCVPVLNQKETTIAMLNYFRSRENRGDIDYIIIDNGSTEPAARWIMGHLPTNAKVIRNETNVGLPKALNQAMALNEALIHADYVFCTHNDVMMYEQGWDQKLQDFLNNTDNVGVAGFFGALGIGVPYIYQAPYEMNQLVRVATISGNRCKLNPAVHHQAHFYNEYSRCAVLDGFALITEKSLRFDESFGEHHMYDNDICLQAIDRGFDNYVINMDVDHLGGRTDVGEDWATGFGKTKQQVHSEAHPPFYEKWRPGNHRIALPFMI
jgi:GT2 family glycosyltransferase